MATGFSVRLFVQVIYFLMVARTLGPREYGVFASALAITSILLPFASWGTGNILVKQVARDSRAFPSYWGAALAATLSSGIILAFLVLGTSLVVFGPSRALSVTLPIALGDLIGTRLADISGQAFQAHSRLAGTSLVMVLIGLCRLLAASVLLATGAGGAETWAFLYGLSGVGSGLLSLAIVAWKLGWGPLSFRPLKGQFKDGFHFSLGLSAHATSNDADKVFVARMVSDQAAGLYAAAYRVLDAAFIPVKSLIYAAYPVFFERGVDGIQAAGAYGRRLAALAAAFSTAAVLMVCIASAFLDDIIGDNYKGIQSIVWALGGVVILRSVHFVAGDTLAGAGYQSYRSLAQVAAGILNIALNLLLIPKLGIHGAVLAGLATNAALAIALWQIVTLLSRKQRL